MRGVCEDDVMRDGVEWWEEVFVGQEWPNSLQRGSEGEE